MPISKIKSDGINDAAITTAKLADSAVNSAKIGVDVIAAEDLAANSVTVSEISNGAVTSAKLDTNIAITGNFTVDTSTLHVDASQNCVGIKTTSLTNETSLVVNGGGVRIGAGGHPGTYGDNSLIYDYDSATGRSRFWSVGNGSTKGEYEFHFRDSSAESALVYMKEGWVGINEADPEAGLHIRDGDNTQNALVIESDAGGGRKWGFRPGDPVTPSNGYFGIRDETAGENRITITDSAEVRFGNSLAGTSMRIQPGGSFCRTYSNTNGSGIHLTSNAVYPTNYAGSLYDANIWLGSAGYRFGGLYAANGTIQTSDINSKQDIENLSDAEKTVATAIKGLIKKFRFIDAVEKKGDDARIHVGVIAQEVEQAFVDAGLDPRRYGIFCEDIWYEVDGESNPDEPYTEDTPGAVRRVRLGIRYDELLAFVISAM